MSNRKNKKTARNQMIFRVGCIVLATALVVTMIASLLTNR